MFLIKELPDKKFIKKSGGEEADATAVMAVLSMLKASSDILVITEKFFAAKGLSHSRFNALALLIKNNGGMYPNELADIMGISRATASTVIKGLLASGMVTAAKADDGRMKKITVTEKGTAAYEEVMPEYFRLLTQAAARNDKKDLKSLPEIMSEISEAVSLMKQFPQ